MPSITTCSRSNRLWKLLLKRLTVSNSENYDHYLTRAYLIEHIQILKCLQSILNPLDYFFKHISSRLRELQKQLMASFWINLKSLIINLTSSMQQLWAKWIAELVILAMDNQEWRSRQKDCNETDNKQWWWYGHTWHHWAGWCCHPCSRQRLTEAWLCILLSIEEDSVPASVEPLCP